jgi:muramidase (phage lysozyme)
MIDGRVMLVGAVAGAALYMLARGSRQEVVEDGENGMVLKVGLDTTLQLDASFGSINWNNAARVPDELRYNSQVKAFMRVIREGESSQGQEAYYMLNGGDLYKRANGYPADLIEVPHPRVYGKGASTTASGAYQIVYQTWVNTAKLRGMEENPIMSPLNQERMVLSLMAVRGAVPAIIRGDVATAIRRLELEWQCFQPVVMLRQGRSVETYRRVFEAWGGVST